MPKTNLKTELLFKYLENISVFIYSGLILDPFHTLRRNQKDTDFPKMLKKKKGLWMTILHFDSEQRAAYHSKYGWWNVCWTLKILFPKVLIGCLNHTGSKSTEVKKTILRLQVCDGKRESIVLTLLSHFFVLLLRNICIPIIYLIIIYTHIYTYTHTLGKWKDAFSFI